MTKLERLFEMLDDRILKSTFFPEEETIIEEARLEAYVYREQKSEYQLFLDKFNELRETKYTGDLASLHQFFKTRSIYSFSDIIKAIHGAMTHAWLMDSNEITRFTPFFILQNDNIAKYISYRGRHNKPESDTITNTESNQSTKDFSAI